ncbi:hypothetical protein [Nonomuraea sp. JJY05]|jgi:hypothetical protein|uniref:hypothetical protein n=1 Tax=Nonomuraea sp. JJY05 TaxID=3350255 RepID=UPI00373E9687
MAVDRERRAAAVARLTALREAGQLTTEHVRRAARGLGVAERTVWRRLGSSRQLASPPQYQPSETDREAHAYFRGEGVFNPSVVIFVRRSVECAAPGELFAVFRSMARCRQPCELSQPQQTPTGNDHHSQRGHQ